MHEEGMGCIVAIINLQPQCVHVVPSTMGLLFDSQEMLCMYTEPFWGAVHRQETAASRDPLHHSLGWGQCITACLHSARLKHNRMGTSCPASPESTEPLVLRGAGHGGRLLMGK